MQDETEETDAEFHAEIARTLAQGEHDEERWTKFIFFGLFVIMICAIVGLATYAALT